MEILLNGIKLNQLLAEIGQLIDSKIGKQPTTEKDHPQFLSRAEVAKLLQISLPTLNEWTKLGWLVSYKIGNRVLYKSLEVEQAIQSLATNKHKKGGRYEN